MDHPGIIAHLDPCSTLLTPAGGPHRSLPLVDRALAKLDDATVGGKNPCRAIGIDDDQLGPPGPRLEGENALARVAHRAVGVEAGAVGVEHQLPHFGVV